MHIRPRRTPLKVLFSSMHNRSNDGLNRQPSTDIKSTASCMIMSVLLAFDFRTLAGAAARALWRDRSQGKPSAGSDGKIEITLPDGSHLQVGNDVSLAALRRVMTVLRG